MNDYGDWICIGVEGCVKDVRNIRNYMKLDGILDGLMVKGRWC